MATYRDFREMLPRKDIDAVLIATGDRWHTMASIYAAKAGKDIYCEKPCSMTIAESQALADTMRRYGRDLSGRHPAAEHPQLRFRRRVVPQRKAGQAHRRSCQHASPGHEPRLASRPARAAQGRDRLGLVARSHPWRPYNRQYVDGGWRNFFDFHGGGILEWGAHTVDLCNWAGTHDEKMPVLYEPTGVDAAAPGWNGGTTPAASPPTMTA